MPEHALRLPARHDRADRLQQGLRICADRRDIRDEPPLQQVLVAGQLHEQRIAVKEIIGEFHQPAHGLRRCLPVKIQLALLRAYIGEDMFQRREVEFFLAAEVMIQQPRIAPDSAGDPVHTGPVKPVIGEFVQRRFQQLRARPFRIALARRFLFRWPRHVPIALPSCPAVAYTPRACLASRLDGQDCLKLHHLPHAAPTRR